MLLLFTPLSGKAAKKIGQVANLRIRQMADASGGFFVYNGWASHPGGTFQMGNLPDDDQFHPHTVTLDGFWIDQTEVTNAQFAAFVNDQGNQMEGGYTWLEVKQVENCQIEHTDGPYRPESGTVFGVLLARHEGKLHPLWYNQDQQVEDRPVQSTSGETSVKTGQLLPKALGCALIRCALSLLILVSTTACGALGVSIERTPMPERTASAVTTTSEPTYLARQTPAQASATPIGTTAPEEPTDQATARPTPKPGTEAQDEIPDRCRVEGHELYVNTENGYCFSYPPGFTPGEFSPGQPAIFGPPLDQSIEPLAAMLGIEVKPVPAGSDLSDLVDVFVAEFANLPLPSITRSPFELGGEPAA